MSVRQRLIFIIFGFLRLEYMKVCLKITEVKFFLTEALLSETE